MQMKEIFDFFISFYKAKKNFIFQFFSFFHFSVFKLLTVFKKREKNIFFLVFLDGIVLV